MANILFTHSYFLRFDPKQWKQQQPYAPLGTIYAAAVLRQAGHTVSLFDTMFSKSPEEIIPVIEKHQPEYLVIYDDGFNYLTKMCLTNMREAAFEMSRMGKNKGCKVIVCSSDSTDHCEKYFDNDVDYIVIGEGEITLLELINNLENKASIEVVEGIAFRNNGNVIKTKKREVLRDLDALPLPAWDLINTDQYRKAWKNKWKYFSMNMVTTRGCPFKCNWCAKPIYGNRYNCHSPERTVSELKCIIQKFNPEHIWFCDDIFGLKPQWINEFADLIEKEKEKIKIKIKFKIQSRVDLLLQENNIAALARAGCEMVWVGAESGSQRILDAMDKGTTVEQIYQATQLLKKYNIKPAFFFQFGYLGETKEDINKTIKMLIELLPEDIGVSVSYPLPGTKFFEKVKSELKTKTNWTDSDELVLMFKNTYQPKFYKRLHYFVHRHYRRKQAAQTLKSILSDPSSINFGKMKKSVSWLYYTPMSFIDSYKLKKLEADS